ncbi:MAG: hypothetical protein RLZ94_1707 [Actinomycetota bacterium]
MDIQAIATALAGRFTAANITPPSGYPNISSSTAEVPGALTSLPAVVVYPPQGSWGFNAGASRVGDLTFNVRIFLAPMHDTPRGATLVNKWHSVLIEQLMGQLALGQSSNGVTHSFITASQAGTMQHADIEYFGVELTVEVHLVEGINPQQ